MPATTISSVGIGFSFTVSECLFVEDLFLDIHPFRFLPQRAHGLAESSHPQDGGDYCPCADKNANPYDARDAIDDLPDSVVIEIHYDRRKQQTRQRVLGKEPHWLPLLSWA